MAWKSLWKNTGSSPRVRSGHIPDAVGDAVRGIISACAERTRRVARRWQPHGDHLRVCGADDYGVYLPNVGTGSSPRVRSGHHCEHRQRVRGWIISACAERTWGTRCKTRSPRDHLRVCGADPVLVVCVVFPMGSSPRVRSGPPAFCVAPARMGIISACAERTSRYRRRTPLSRDHLRVCGADGQGRVRRRPEAGSSPRVRNGQGRQTGHRGHRGIISACAERTRSRPANSRATWDHLRVCGADLTPLAANWAVTGSSPRVRSGPLGAFRLRGEVGIISACAERTADQDRLAVRFGDHLRVCGADAHQTTRIGRIRGSSPRVRSGRTAPDPGTTRIGIISACAERTRRAR